MRSERRRKGARTPPARGRRRRGGDRGLRGSPNGSPRLSPQESERAAALWGRGGDRERRAEERGGGGGEDPRRRRLAVGAVSRHRAGQGGSRWRRGTRRRLPGTAGPANVTVSPAERSHPLTRSLAPTRATARPRGPQHPSPHPPGGYLQLPSAEVATFSEPAAAAAPSSRLRSLAPFGLGSRRPALPSPLGAPRRLHHISPRSAAHARGRAGGSGARGCACIARLLLAAHAVHGSEGAGEGGTGPSAAPRLLQRLRYRPPPLRSGDPRAGIPPPLSPRRARYRRRRSP